MTRRPPVEIEVVVLPRWGELRRRLPRLLCGIVVLGLGISMIIEAHLGVAPYDVFHQGLAHQTGLSFGTVVVGVGILILVLWIPIGQRLGVGTIVNTLTVGFVVDFGLHLYSRPHALAARWGFLVAGIVITSVGMALYITAGLGPGPRDGLMTGIAAKGYPIWAVRTVLELTALVVGWTLGGDVGVGTVLFAFGIGPLGHFFLGRLHLGHTRADLGPGLAAE